jgi:hypothetical protein
LSGVSFPCPRRSLKTFSNFSVKFSNIMGHIYSFYLPASWAVSI